MSKWDRFILIIMIVVLTTCFGAKATTHEKVLSDSLLQQINRQVDGADLQETFDFIRKKRGNLGEYYLPLLTSYAKQAQRVGYERGQMKAYDFIGLENRYRENYDTAYVYHSRSLEMATRLNDSTQMFYNYNNLGQVFRMQDINTLAMDNFLKALEISNAVGNLRSSSYTMNTIGATLVVQKDYQRAMKYFHLSSEIARQRNDKRTLAYNYGNIGEIYLFESQPDSAMYYFEISRDLLLDLNSNKGMGVAEHLIGQALFELEDYEAAKQKFKIAIEYHKQDRSQRYQSLCNCYLGKIATMEKDFGAANTYLSLAREQALEINSLKNLVEAYDSFAELFIKQNKWKEAYTAKQQSNDYAGQIINEKNNSTIHALEIGFETKEKEQEIKLLYSENKAKNQGIIVLIASSLSLLLLLAVMVLLSLKRKKQNEVSQLSLKQQLLRSQMNPHFLFNALGSIQNFMYRNETKKAASYLGNFASLTRSILEHSAEEFVPLSAEIETLHNYVKLEQMRVKNNFEYFIDYDDELDTEFIFVPPMLIQPFVENAIKHGLKNIDYPGKLQIQFVEKNSRLEIKVIDNGCGIKLSNSKDDALKTHRSMSMQIFKERRDILSKRFNKKVHFELLDRGDKDSTKKGTEVLIVIPV